MAALADTINANALQARELEWGINSQRLIDEHAANNGNVSQQHRNNTHRLEVHNIRPRYTRVGVTYNTARRVDDTYVCPRHGVLILAIREYTAGPKQTSSADDPLICAVCVDQAIYRRVGVQCNSNTYTMLIYMSSTYCINFIYRFDHGGSETT
jgi:hypothetical protein